MAKTYVVPQSSAALIQGGLTPAQASLYETLVQHGSLNARRASFIASIPRTLGYKILGELVEMGLVVKNEEPKSVAKFAAAHPLKLKEIAEKKFEEARESKIALEGALDKLILDFNRASGSQGQVLQGISGLKELLAAQFAQKKPLMTTIIENTPTKLTLSIVFE